MCCEGFGGAGAGLGFANMLAQLRVPSGFEAGFAGSEGCAGCSAVTFSQEDSKVLSAEGAAGVSQLPVATWAAVSGVDILAQDDSPVVLLTLRGPLVEAAAAAAARAPRLAPRPRSTPRLRPPRALSEAPRPRPPRPPPDGTSFEVVAPESFALDTDRSLVFFFTSPH